MHLLAVASDRAVFVQNVYKEMDGKHMSLMAHHDCSRVLEKLALVSTDQQLAGLFGALAGQGVRAVTARNSSHVVQALLASAVTALSRGPASGSGVALDAAVLTFVDVRAVQARLAKDGVTVR